jgi:phosphoglycerol geranylgeranyltransferase
MMNKKKLAQQLHRHAQIGQKSLAILLDPDKTNTAQLQDLVHDAMLNNVSYFFVGGSLISNYQLQNVILSIKALCEIPIVLFPGNSLHIVAEADGLLMLSLISGRNPEYLIGQHVTAAPLIQQSQLEVLPTGYILIDGGRATTVSYISNTNPIPADKPEIAACTALAGQFLGLQYMYLDAGSGAQQPVSSATITAVRKAVQCPLIVGGGINSRQKAIAAWQAGADLLVVGNKLEQEPQFINQLGAVMAELNQEAAILN